MAKAKKEVDEGKLVYITKVRVDLFGLAKTIEDLEDSFKEIGHKETKEGRSRFSRWNNIKKFHERLMTGEIPSDVDPRTGYAIFTMEGRAKGNTSRIYHTPSMTSLGKEVRKHIIPIKDGNVFVYFDLKAAEFFMNCVFCGEQEAIQAYQRGEDIYKTYEHIFPKGTPRAAYKQALIGNMYGLTGYRLALELQEQGIQMNQTQAERLLEIVAKNLKNMTANKSRVIGNALRTKSYQCPNGFDQRNLITIAKPKEGEQVNALLALSSYVQSALGVWMQELVRILQPKLLGGTMITVFDSVTCEIKRESVDKYKEWVARTIPPFRIGDVHVGETFYEAQESE